MHDTFACPHCGLGHSRYQRQCEITGLPIEAPSVQEADVTGSDPEPAASAPPAPPSEGTATGSTPMAGDPFADQLAAAPVRMAILGGELTLVPGRTIVIGRLSEDLANAGSLPDNVSGVHASIRCDRTGRIYLRDIGSDGRGSTNGTFVNRTRLQPNIEVQVEPSDEIVLGQAPGTRVEILR